MMDAMEIGGGYLHYHYQVSDPANPVVVFANSLGTDFRIWNLVLSAVGSSHNILLYDKRGHGLSELVNSESSIREHAADLIGLMEALSIKSATLVGLSIGGLIAQETYHQRADMVDALVLTNTATRIGTEDIWNERIEAVRTNGMEAIADAVLDRWFSGKFRNSHPDRFSVARCMLLQTPPNGYVSACMALRDADLTARASSISVPTLCIAGSDDLATPPEIVEQMSDNISGSEYSLLGGVGHIPCLESPEGFTAKLLPFLNRLQGQI